MLRNQLLVVLNKHIVFKEDDPILSRNGPTAQVVMVVMIMVVVMMVVMIMVK
jgi:hypothetical protein